MADQPGYVGLQGSKRGAPLYGGVPVGSGGFSNGGSILNRYGINVDGLQQNIYGSSQQALPTDSVWVGARALGLPTVTAGHDTGRFSGSTTYDNAQNLIGAWYANDPKMYKEFMSKAIMYKLANADAGLPEMGQVWDNLLQTAIQLNKANPTGKNWTPWDVMESYNHKPGSMGTRRVGDFLVDNATGEKVKYVGPRTKTTKHKQIDLSNPEQVQAVATQVLTQMIGRAPSDKELAQFKSSLNAYERANPSVATTTTTYSGMGEEVGSSTVTTGGVDDAARAAVLSEGLKKTKEYGKYQSGTTYFNALMQMIGGS